MMNDVQETVLSNGVRVVTSALSHVDSVTFGIWVGVGARYESNKMAGVSHFIEHLLFKGTKKRSARDISIAIEGRGGYLNAFTQEENTCFYARVAYDKLWGALGVLSDMYLNASLAQAEIEKERGVIVEEIMMYRDQPQHMVHEMLTDALWQGHPLGRPIIGFPKSLAGMKRKDIFEFRKKCYTPENTLFAFAGKVDHSLCVAKVKQITGRLGKRTRPKFRMVTAKVRQRSVLLKNKDIEQSHLALGIRLFGRHDKRRYALRLLNTVLGENMSSRLFQIVREKHGLAYSVHSSYHLYRETGALVVSAGLDKTKHEKALRLIVKELTRLKTTDVPAAELKRAKDYVIGQLRLALESTTSQMMWLGENIMSHGEIILPAKTIDTISKITISDVRHLAQSVLRSSRTSVAVISPGVSAKDETWARKIIGSL